MKKINIAKITLPQSENLTYISNLSTMLSAGISILQSIESLSRNKKGNIKVLLDVIHQDLLAGKPLSHSFSKFPRIFNKVTVNMIRASEEAGTLDVTLKDLKQQIKKEIEFRNKLRSALLYPASVMLVFIGVLLLILLVVIPKIAIVFSNMKVTMPLPTKIMIFVSNLLIYNTWIVVLALILAVSGCILLYRLKREKVLSFVYSLPIVSKLVHEIDLMQFTRSMHLLLSSGITITVALELTEEIVRKKEIANGINFAKGTVLAGNTISVAFRKHYKVFPDIMITLLETGEKTGTLDKSMLDISEYFEDRVSESLKTLVTILEPIVLVAVGILVGSMMLAIMGPIYSLIGQISPR